MSKVI